MNGVRGPDFTGREWLGLAIGIPLGLLALCVYPLCFEWLAAYVG